MTKRLGDYLSSTNIINSPETTIKNNWNRTNKSN